MAADEFSRFLGDMDGPGFVRKPGVAVFDAHEEYDGEKLVRRFTKADLKRIADNCNRREKKGSLCPITIGHTDPDDPREKAQPEHVGFARNFRVDYSKRLGRWVVVSDFYLRRERYGEARSYPRVSVELWPTDNFLDPIALLRRTPQRDLGQWHYSRAGAQNAKCGVWSYSRSARAGRLVLRYSMAHSNLGASMHDDEELMDDAPGEGDAPAEPSHEEKAEQFLKHCMSHPHAAHFAKHYAMPAGGATDEPAPEGEGDLPPPDADREPEQFGMAAPSATNGAVPGQEPDQFAKRDAARLRRGRELVSQLKSENFVLDEKAELRQFAKLGPRAAKAYADKIRLNYKKAPVGGERVPTAKNRTAASQARKRSVHDMTTDELKKCVKYQKQGMPYMKAACKAMGIPYKGE